MILDPPNIDQPKIFIEKSIESPKQELTVRKIIIFRFIDFLKSKYVSKILSTRYYANSIAIEWSAYN